VTRTGVPRGQFRSDLVYVGWQQAGPAPAPGPVPEAPGPVVLDQVSPDWVAARHREQLRLARPARLGMTASLAVLAASAGCWLAGRCGVRPLAAAPESAVQALAAVVCLGAAGYCGRALWRGNVEIAAVLAAEEDRVAAFRAVQRAQFAGRQQRYARDYSAWRQRNSAYWRGPRWHPVTIPTSVHRLDVAGGTLAGWSALLTMLAVPRLAAGGEVTVIDLTEGAVAADLIVLARRLGLDPLVWVLPDDLPRLDLGTGLSREALADLLALTVGATDAYGRAAAGPAAGTSDPARDAALLAQVLETLGDDATMAQLTAALRAIAQVGGARRQLESTDLWRDQLTRLAGLFGRGGERIVIERALAMEAKLRALAPVASALPAREPSRLKVAWLDRRATATGNAVLGSYLVVALTALLRQAPAGRPWQHAVCLLGAERLPGDALDRLCDAAEAVGAGLVLGYRSIPAHVRERLGRGNSAIAFMRLGNADDARVAAEQIGTQHRFVLSQLTQTVGASVTDTAGDSCTSTVGTADSVSDSVSLTTSAGRSRGHGRQGAFAPFADFTRSVSKDTNSSVALSDARSVTEGISASTTWGLNTSRAIGGSDSLAASAQRSREFVVEASELQRLPHTAALLSYPGAAGRSVLLADANPAIMTLPTATLGLLQQDEAGSRRSLDLSP
jgi:hypothetical protein